MGSRSELVVANRNGSNGVHVTAMLRVANRRSPWVGRLLYRATRTLSWYLSETATRFIIAALPNNKPNTIFTELLLGDSSSFPIDAFKKRAWHLLWA